MSTFDIFVSYASPDKEVAEALVSSLEERGAKCWIAPRNIDPGSDYGGEIIKGIQNSVLFVLVFSAHSNKSKHVLREVDRAIELDRTIVPVKIDKTLPMGGMDYRLCTVQWVELGELPIPRKIIDDILVVLAAAKQRERTKKKDMSKEENHESDEQNYHQYIELYKQNLISEINNNLVLELYDKPHYEDICITPLVFSTDSLGKLKKVVEINKVLASSKVSIIGEPGSGKTTALRKLALDLLHQSPTEILPVFISLASFSSEYKEKTIKDFQEYLNREVSLFGCPNINLFEQAGIKLILLLDGWDEIIEEGSRNNIKQHISGLKHKFIITSRPEAQRTLPFTDRYEMHPLSGDRVREFIRLRIKNDEVVENVFQWLSRDHTLVKLAENPLNLSIIAIVSTEGGGIRGLNKTKLYERALECIVRQHYRENPYERYLAEDVQPLQIELILQHLAYNTISSEGRFFSQRELDKAAKSVLDVVPSGLSRLLSGRLGIIRDRKAGRMEFFHLWYQEFLAARYIIESDEDIIEQLNNKKLAGVLPYIVGLHPDTTFTFDLLKKIGIHDPFNFCRAIGEGCFSDDQIYELIRRIISFGESQKPKIPVRIELSRAISQLSFNGINSLIKIVKDEQLNDYTRRAALEALSILQIKREQFESVLLDILETSSLGLLWHVLEHIGKNKVKGALGKLLEYKNHPNPIVAGDVIWGINEIRENKLEELPPNVVESLIQCLSSDDLHLQGHALRTLGRLRIANAIPRLKDHLANKEAGYRWIVPEAAALIAVAESLEIFNVAIDDHDTKVVAAALKGLAEYDGTVSEHILNKIKSHFDDENWISFLEQPLGIVARLTFEKLVNKRKPQNIARVFVSRHCKTSWNLEGRLQGTKDLSLSEEGRKEALDNVKNISELRIDRIVTSNSKRAYETAQIYAEKLGIPVHIHPGLRELDHGRWEGVRINDLLNDESSNYRKWLDNPTGVSIPDSVESITTAQQRILEAIRNIALRYNGENVLVITHKHIRALLKCAINNYGLEDFENRIEESIEPHEIERTKLLRLCGTEMEIL